MASGEVRVSAAGEAFAALAKDLRKAGSVTLRRELYKGLSRSARPVIAAIKANTSTLPSGGGRGRRRTRMVDTGRTLTNQASGKTHKVKERRKVGGSLAAGESLADRVAGATFVAKQSTGRNPGIRIVATEKRGKKIDLARLNKGEVRHPVFGRWRKGTPTQRVTPGWFDRPIEANLDEFRKGILAAVDAVEKEISGGR